MRYKSVCPFSHPVITDNEGSVAVGMVEIMLVCVGTVRKAFLYPSWPVVGVFLPLCSQEGLSKRSLKQAD